MTARHPTIAVALALGLVRPEHALADDPVKEARATVALFKKADPGLSRFFGNATGYAVFPGVGKGAIGLGGAHGSGVLFEKGRAVGTTTLTQVTIGLQLGGQAYSEVVFLETARALADFKGGKFALAAQASAVAATAGAAANARYQQGVAVFTMAKGGLMFEASVGGQKFGFEPFGKNK
jgi:lipid-binding SYLF domain-containing protein